MKGIHYNQAGDKLIKKNKVFLPDFPTTKKLLSDCGKNGEEKGILYTMYQSLLEFFQHLQSLI